MIIAPAEVVAVLRSGSFTFANLIEFQLSETDTIFTTDASIPIAVGGEVFEPNGFILDMEYLSRSTDLSLDEWSVDLTLANRELLAILAKGEYHYKPITVRRVLLDSNYQLIAGWEGVTIRSGLLSHYDTNTTSTEPTITLSAVSRWFEYERPNDWATNPDSHRRRYPTDLSMSYVKESRPGSGE